MRLSVSKLLSNIVNRSHISGFLAVHYEVLTRDITQWARLTTLHSGDFEDF